MKLKTVAKRLFWPDFCRAIAMYLVIVIHTAPSLPPPSLFAVFSYVFFSLTKISVPLFVMVSGALLIPKEESYRTFFTKRMIHVFIPWIFWTILSVLWQFYSGQEHPHTSHDWISLFHVTFFTQYWFIPMLFTLYLLTPLFHLFAVNAKKIDLIYIIILWFIGVSLVPSITALTGIHLFNQANIFLQYTGYYLLGYMLRDIPYEKEKTREVFVLFISSIAALTIVQWIALVVHLPADTWVLGFISPLSISATLSFFALCLMFEKYYGKVIPQGVTTWIFSIGSATLGIYFIHIFLMQMILHYFYPLSMQLPYLIAVLYVSLPIFFLSFFCVWIIRKIPILRFLVP